MKSSLCIIDSNVLVHLFDFRPSACRISWRFNNQIDSTMYVDTLQFDYVFYVFIQLGLLF